MELAPTIPMHPVDLLYGYTLPQLQTYVVAGPAVRVDIEGLKGQLETLIPERFTKLCYRQQEHLFPGRLLHLTEDITAPVHHYTLEEFERLTPADMRQTENRHWRLHVIQSDRLVILVFMVGHWLCHGTTARRFIYATLDLLYPDKPPGVPPELDEEQWTAYRAFQDRLNETYRLEHDFSEYRRVTFPVERARALYESMDATFTDTVMLWLARSIHDAAPRERTMEIVIFRMAREAVDRWLNDPAFMNEGLLVELWQMLPDGFYTRVDPAQGLGSQKIDEATRFYRRFPIKGLLCKLMKRNIDKGKTDHQQKDHERLVINNLGATDYPFFRGMFFDPFNKANNLGLVFVDSTRGELVLQFAPPKQYLETFDWEAFEDKLDENLNRMIGDPRIETR